MKWVRLVWKDYRKHLKHHFQCFFNILILFGENNIQFSILFSPFLFNKIYKLQFMISWLDKFQNYEVLMYMWSIYLYWKSFENKSWISMLVKITEFQDHHVYCLRSLRSFINPFFYRNQSLKINCLVSLTSATSS